MLAQLINDSVNTLAVLPADPTAYVYYLSLMAIGSLIVFRVR
jgi:hypothetical protein